jgi:hypothetical protein
MLATTIEVIVLFKVSKIRKPYMEERAGTIDASIGADGESR